MDFFRPIQQLADWLTYSIFSIEQGSDLAKSINFFIYDSIKIILLLIIINYIMAVVRHYLPVERMREFLMRRKWYGLDYLLASIFGAVTPFCSCSSIPFFVGFVGAGIPIGVVFSFLITSPLVNEAAVVLMAGAFGWKLTLVYVLSGITLGLVGGLILSKVDVNKHINKDILKLSEKVKSRVEYERIAFKVILLKVWWRETYTLTLKLLPYVLLGVGIGASIHGFVPQEVFGSLLGNNTWWIVPVAVLLAVPLYSNAVGVVPIMQSLIAKGVAIGTSLAFMMATVGLSLPEALILKKVMSLKLLVAYFTIVAFGIMIIGWTINMFFRI